MDIGSILDLIGLFAAGLWLLPHVRRFLEAHGRLEANFLGRPVPCGLGVVLWLLIWLQEGMLQARLQLAAAGLAVGGGHVAALAQREADFRAFVLAATVVFLAGWTDDLIGSKSVKGLRGHCRYWRQTRTFSMGAVKAAAVFGAGAWLLLATAGDARIPIWQMGIRLLLLLLLTNTLNLLDVRPGRALKAFLPGCLFLLLIVGPSAGLLPLLPAAAGGLLLFYQDVQGKGMLGDAGANLLGFTLGYGVVMTCPPVGQIGLIAVLAYVHLLAETSSLTLLIERNRILNWIDRWGRT